MAVVVGSAAGIVLFWLMVGSAALDGTPLLVFGSYSLDILSSECMAAIGGLSEGVVDLTAPMVLFLCEGRLSSGVVDLAAAIVVLLLQGGLSDGVVDLTCAIVLLAARAAPALTSRSSHLDSVG